MHNMQKLFKNHLILLPILGHREQLKFTEDMSF